MMFEREGGHAPGQLEGGLDSEVRKFVYQTITEAGYKPEKLDGKKKRFTATAEEVGREAEEFLRAEIRRKAEEQAVIKTPRKSPAPSGEVLRRQIEEAKKAGTRKRPPQLPRSDQAYM